MPTPIRVLLVGIYAPLAMAIRDHLVRLLSPNSFVFELASDSQVVALRVADHPGHFGLICLDASTRGGFFSVLELPSWFKDRGYRGKIVAVSHVEEDAAALMRAGCHTWCCASALHEFIEQFIKTAPAPSATPKEDSRASSA